MSLADVFGREDRTEVKFSEFFALVKQAAQYETLMNAVNCDVPHRFIRETMTGKKETAPKEPGTVVTVTFDTEEFEKGLQGVIEQIEAKFGPAEDEAEQEQEAAEQEQISIHAPAKGATAFINIFSLAVRLFFISSHQ